MKVKNVKTMKWDVWGYFGFCYCLLCWNSAMLVIYRDIVFLFTVISFLFSFTTLPWYFAFVNKCNILLKPRQEVVFCLNCIVTFVCFCCFEIIILCHYLEEYHFDKLDLLKNVKTAVVIVKTGAFLKLHCTIGFLIC